MKLSRHNKLLMFETEFIALLLVIALALVFYSYMHSLMFYLLVLLLGFVFYFWMLYEEKLHKKGKKHAYFEHTSSYIMLGQTGLVLGLLFMVLGSVFLMFTAMIISIIMYSVSLSRITLYKAVFTK